MGLFLGYNGLLRNHHSRCKRRAFFDGVSSFQSRMVFDNSTVESATIIPLENTTNTYGVNLKLKTIAANQLGRLTGEKHRKTGQHNLKWYCCILINNSRQARG